MFGADLLQQIRRRGPDDLHDSLQLVDVFAREELRAVQISHRVITQGISSRPENSSRQAQQLFSRRQVGQHTEISKSNLF